MEQGGVDIEVDTLVLHLEGVFASGGDTRRRRIGYVVQHVAGTAVVVGCRNRQPVEQTEFEAYVEQALFLPSEVVVTGGCEVFARYVAVVGSRRYEAQARIVADGGVTLRTVGHAQFEVGEYAVVLEEILLLDVPHTADCVEQRVAVVLTEPRRCVVAEREVEGVFPAVFVVHAAEEREHVVAAVTFADVGHFDLRTFSYQVEGIVDLAARTCHESLRVVVDAFLADEQGDVVHILDRLEFVFDGITGREGVVLRELTRTATRTARGEV